jgi:hypothetical protein
MSVVFSGTNQGSFISTGQSISLALPSGVDWMWVYNQTQQYAAGAGQGVEYYWQLGYTQGRGTQYTKTAVTNALAVSQIAANGGFFLVNNTVNIPGNITALTGITANTGAFNSPQVLTGNTNNLPVTAVVGADVPAGVVRILNTVGARQLGGIDFSVANVVNNTSFDLIYMASIVGASPGAGSYRVIPYDPYFYPTSRIITKIEAINGVALITLSVTHGYTVGQNVRFVIPTVTAAAFGMPQLNGLSGTIIQVGAADADGSTNTIAVNIDVSSFGTFAWPLTGSPGFTPPQVVPIGENTAIALNTNNNILADATVNDGFFGMMLQAGVNSPAGSTDDVIYWVAGKSFNV